MIRISINNALQDIIFWKRFVFGTIFLALCYFWYSGMMLHHVWNSPFHYKGADLSYWIFHWLRIDRLVDLGIGFNLAFSALLLGSFLAGFIFIHKRWIAIMAGVLLLIYQIQFNSKIGYHTHHLFGFQFALLPFYFRENLSRQALGLARILCVLAYFFAGFFKLYQGAWLSYDSFAYVLENQHAAYLYFNPDGLRSRTVKFMIEHHGIGYVFFISAMLLQLSFILGLFTNKYNKFLALFIVLFHIMDWFLMNLGVFMGMTLMAWLLLYKHPSE